MTYRKSKTPAKNVIASSPPNIPNEELTLGMFFAFNRFQWSPIRNTIVGNDRWCLHYCSPAGVGDKVSIYWNCKQDSSEVYFVTVLVNGLNPIRHTNDSVPVYVLQQAMRDFYTDDPLKRMSFMQYLHPLLNAYLMHRDQVEAETPEETA